MQHDVDKQWMTLKYHSFVKSTLVRRMNIRRMQMKRRRLSIVPLLNADG